ncbi:MAG: GntR family transcriptional regulator [Dongiaceae bacterium]
MKALMSANQQETESDNLEEPKTCRGISQANQAYIRLEELIVTLQLAPGTVLTEQTLIQMLNMGRTPIREALQRLALEGLVIILPRRGILIATISIRNQLELLRLRREVQRLMVRYAALRCTVAERAQFRRIADQIDQVAAANDDVAFMRLDLELDILLGQTCRNEYAQRTVRLISSLARRFWYQHKQVVDLPRSARLHAALARAVANGDGELAITCSDALIDYIQEFAHATLEERT